MKSSVIIVIGFFLSETLLAAGFRPRSVRSNAAESDSSASIYEVNSQETEKPTNNKSPKKRTSKKAKKKRLNQQKKRKKSQSRQERRKAAPKKRNKQLPSPDEVEDAYPKTGLGLGIGYESRYGNGFSFHLMPAYFLDVNAGFGYNRSGYKGGIGSDFVLNFARGFGAIVGGSYVYSLGQKASQVQLAASFSPEGGGSAREVNAEKDYEVGAAQIAAATVGLFYDATTSLKISLNGHYSQVLSGNEVKFKDGIRYDQRIEATNEAEFDKEFKRKAEDDVAAGGVGASLGLTVFF